MRVIVLAGFLSGTIIAALAVALEHYGPTFGRYALVGNGALIVPSVLAPFAIYAGWTWVRRRGGRALELALFVLGLHFGVGMVSVFDAVFFPSRPGITIVDALPGLLFSGAIFVLPAALLAASAYWLALRLNGIALTAALLVFVAVAAFLGSLFGLGLGLIAGAAVALAERMPQRVAALTVTVFVALVILGNLGYATLLLALPV